jgi:two-component system, response regulator
MIPQQAPLNTILVVDDNPDDFYAVQRELTRSGLSNPLVLCESAETALDYLHRRGKFAEIPVAKPAMILLDINMPRMTGTEFLRTIRSNPTHGQVPVIMMTSSNDDRDVLAAFEGGANSYILKPVSFGGLIGAIQRIKSHTFELLLTPRG